VLPHRRRLVVAGAGILQQAAGDGANALDLGQHQRQLFAHRRGRLPQLQLHQLHVAEDHRQGVVDLVGHPGAELAEGRQLLADQQLLAGLGQHVDVVFELGGLLLKALGALSHLLLQLVGAAGQLLLVRRLLVQHGVELATELGQLVIGVEGQHADAGRLTRLYLAHHLVHPLDGGEQVPRTAIDQQAGEQQQHHHAGAQLQQVGEVGADDGPLEKTDVEHADALTIGAQERLVARHIPGVVHEGAINPGLTASQHLLAHRCRHPGAHRPPQLATAAGGHVGAHPQIAEKQGDGADAAGRQGVLGEHLALELVHQPGAAVDELAPLQHAPEAAVPPHHRGQREADQAAGLLPRHRIIFPLQHGAAGQRRRERQQLLPRPDHEVADAAPGREGHAILRWQQIQLAAAAQAQKIEAVVGGQWHHPLAQASGGFAQLQLEGPGIAQVLEVLGLALLLHAHRVVCHAKVAAHRGEQILPAVGEGPVEGQSYHAGQSQHDGHRGEQQQTPAHLGSEQPRDLRQPHDSLRRQGASRLIRWPTP